MAEVLSPAQNLGTDFSLSLGLLHLQDRLLVQGDEQLPLAQHVVGIFQMLYFIENTMKEDHMMNGQLKPAYNVQIAVENYSIVHGYVSNDRTDYNTLSLVLEKHRNAFGDTLEAVTADSGYCSEKNLLYLKESEIRSYIKLQGHEKRKTRAYKEDIGKYYNMTYAVFENEPYYICHDGRELRHIRAENKERDGYTQTVEVYGCADCSGCEHKSKCLYKYNAEKNPDRNKVMKINERWEELKEESNAEYPE